MSTRVTTSSTEKVHNMPSDEKASRTLKDVDSCLHDGDEGNTEKTVQENAQPKDSSAWVNRKSHAVHAHLPPFTVRNGFLTSLGSAADKSFQEDNNVTGGPLSSAKDHDGEGIASCEPYGYMLYGQRA